MSQVQVIDNTERHRFEAAVGGASAGFIDYRVRPGVFTVLHTEVDPKFEGQGVAGVLVRHALDQLRDDGSFQLVSECSYVTGWLSKHPDYQQLLQPRGSQHGS